MQLPIIRTVPVFASLLLLILGYLLNPLPSDPDMLFSNLNRWGAFSIFGFWSLGLIAWGRVIAVLLRDEVDGWLEWLLYGTASASLMALIFGHLGLISYGMRPFCIAFLFIGPLVDLFLRQKSNQWTPTRSGFRLLICGVNSNKTAAGLSVLFLSGIIFQIFSRINGAFIPHYHSDPMFYHLLGPRLWSDAGKIYFTWMQPAAMQCSYWEALALWGNILLGGPQGGGLIEGILFMQWAHVLFGYFATAVALNRLLAHLAIATSWRRLGIFAGLTSGAVGWTVWQAKNDWGLAFWTIGALCLILQAHSGKRSTWIISGLLLGLVCVNKLVLGIITIPILCMVLWEKIRSSEETKTKSYSSAILVIIGLSASSIPILLRNWIMLGNPVFPTMNTVFNSRWLTESFAKVVSGPQQSPNFLLTLDRIKFLLREDSLYFLGLACLPAFLLMRKNRLPLIFLSPSIALAALLTMVGPPVGMDDKTLHLRFLGFMLPLGQALGIGLMQRIADLSSKMTIAGVMVQLLLFGFAATRFQYPLVTELLNPAESFRAVALAGDSKSWLRMNATHSLIITTGDTQLYPIAHLNPGSIVQLPYLDWISRNTREPRRLVAQLRDLNIEFILDSKTPLNTDWSPAAAVLNEATFSHPEAVIFQGRHSKVIDLKRLYNEIFLSTSRWDAKN